MTLNRPKTALLAVLVLLAGCGVGQATSATDESAEDSVPVPVEVSFPDRSDSGFGLTDHQVKADEQAPQR